MNRKDRRDRILDVAIDLAEAGGFDNVRQRDVADQAGIALGTLYKSFPSKENILVAALERETQTLERKMAAKPAQGATPAERLDGFFKITTRAMCSKPKYARAVLRAMASGEPEVAGSVAQYQERMNRLIVAAIRGAEGTEPGKEANAREQLISMYLQRIWFASLVAWSAGLQGQAEVISQMRTANELLLRATE